MQLFFDFTKLFRTALALVLLGFTSSIVLASDVSVSVALVPRASYTLSEAYEVAEQGKFLENLASISLTNSSSTAYQLKVRVQVFSSKLGSEAILDYVTNYNAFAIDLPANGSYSISNTEITEAMLDYGQTVGDHDNVADRLQAAYEEDLIKSSGLIPEDEYTYKLSFFDKDESDTNVLNFINVVASYQESIYIPFELGNISLIYPSNGDVLSSSVQYPTFYWSAVSVRDSVDITYKTSIWKLINGDVESSIVLKPIVQEKTTNINNLSYPDNAEPLLANQEYVWQVEAFDEAGYRVGLAGSSDTATFKFGDVNPPAILNQHLEFSTFPAQLNWTHDDPNASFVVVISAYSDLSDPLFKEEVSGTMLMLDNADLFHPGKKYYWAVLLKDDSNSYTQSETASFVIELDISIIYPMGDTLSAERVSLYWNASDKHSYQVALSTSKQFKQSKHFTVEGTQLTISNADIAFKAGETYYWRVALLDDYGNLSTDYSDTGFFTIEAIEAVTLVYPVDERVESPKINFVFQEASWADNYHLTLYKEKNSDSPFFEMDLTGSPFMLDTSRLNSFDNHSKYRWQVEAVNRDAGLQNSSEMASFYFSLEQSIQLLSFPQFLNSKTLFTWRPISAAHRYKILFSEDSSFETVKTFSTRHTRYSLPKALRDSPDLFFRIQSFDKHKELLAQSDIEVIKAGELENSSKAIVYVSPVNTVNAEKPWHFYWLNAAKRSILEIATNKQFMSSKTFEINGNKLNPKDIDYDFRLNKLYYWRIKGSNNVSTFVLRERHLKLISPISKRIDSPDLLFEWMGAVGNSYRILIAKSDTLSSPLVYDSKQTQYRVRLRENAVYYWQVQQLDASGRVIQRSNIGKFELHVQVQSIMPRLMKELDYFVKQQVSDNSPLKSSDWELENIESKDGSTLSDVDVQYLIKHPESIIKVVE